ncbi:MAG: hypothetical protein HC875_35350 [Anaerolineales bacterium]|nr:hypothetical protein [Anaerolineales bacterium]
MPIVSLDQTKNLLTNLPTGVRIELTKLPSGEVAVLPVTTQEMPKTKAQIIAEEFANLTDKSISLSEASRKYSKELGVKIPHANFSRWATAGIIEVKGNDGFRLLVREADVAYCAKIYKEKFEQHGGNLRGVTLFDADGNPYQMKYPDLAERKRESRRRKKQN